MIGRVSGYGLCPWISSRKVGAYGYTCTKIGASETKPKVSFIDLKVVASCIYGVTHFVLQVLGVGTLTKLPKTFRLALVSLK